MIESGATRWPDGSLPVNTHGGSNGEAFIHGVNHILEAVRQLRGTSTCQVEGAEVTLVTGAITDPAGAILLGRG
jgi:acetyl-CoA acetyltransferase